MICIAELTFYGGASRYSARSHVQLGNELNCLTRQCGQLSEKSGRIGIGELFEAFQGVAHPALPVDFLEPFQTPG
jgi:hypothetical protein